MMLTLKETAHMQMRVEHFLLISSVVSRRGSELILQQCTPIKDHTHSLLFRLKLGLWGQLFWHLYLRNSLKAKGTSENESITANTSSLHKLEATLGVFVRCLSQHPSHDCSIKFCIFTHFPYEDKLARNMPIEHFASCLLYVPNHHNFLI